MLRSGRFAVTAELNAPDSANRDDIYANALVLAEVCDAINATDGSGANCHMSSLACCALLADAGYETVLQVSCRDRNRIAIQGDLLGAAALGIRNVLCLTGDDVSAGDQPEARRVFDLDSIQLLQVARMMRDDGVFLSGRRLSSVPRLFLGAVENPFAPPFEWRPQRLAKKVRAGAQFVQTQLCFDMPLFARFMQGVRDLGLHEQVAILAGVGPLRSAKAAEFMRARVPGIWIPDSVLRRMRAAATARQAEEGRRICIEIIEQVREIAGVRGVHLMAYRQEEAIVDIAHRARLLPRPQPRAASPMSKEPFVETVLSSPTRTVIIGPNRPFVIIGERINPTGRKLLALEMARGDFERVRRDAIAQVAAGAHVLDVNAGVPLTDEPALLSEAIRVVQEAVDVPICIDSSVVDALRSGLAAVKGKALVNSVTGEEERLETVLPMVAEHKAAVIAVANDETGISQDPRERLAVARRIVERAESVRHRARRRDHRPAEHAGGRRARRGADAVLAGPHDRGGAGLQHHLRGQQHLLRPAGPAGVERGVPEHGARRPA